MDGETFNPISSVNVFNSKDNTISNEDGKFIFYSDIDTVIISHIGYKKVKTNFNNLKRKDTIFLNQQNIALNEVEIKNRESFIKKVYGRVNHNFPFFEYGEKSFLRCIVKKNNKIIDYT